MYTDDFLKFSDAQAITADVASTNTIDIGVARNIFDGEPMVVMITVDVAAKTSDGNETYEFQIETDDNDSFSSATDLVVHAIDKADLTLGSIHFIPIPVGVEVERYLRLFYNVGGTNPTITVTAFLMPLRMTEQFRTYNDNVTIS